MVYNAKNEIKRAKIKEDEYGRAIYDNALECYNAILPIIEKERHSGFSYHQLIRILIRMLKEKPLTPITENDFGTEIDKDQCFRYTSLFKHTDKNGNITYSDVERIVCIDQYGLSWHSGLVERLCADLIPQIKLPYMPTDHPIEIYYWDFSYERKKKTLYKERGSFNALFIDKIVFPNGKAITIKKLCLDDKLTKPTKRFYRKLEKFIKKDIEDFENRTGE